MDDRHSVYRKIRYDRTYRPLGRMSWWRIVAGILLLLLVFCMTGIVSRPFVARGNFRMAERLLLFPAWMETYRPVEKAYLDAGVLYQDGDYEAARDALDGIDLDAARQLKSLAALKLAEEKLSAGDAEAAAAAFAEVDVSLLPEKETPLYESLRAALAIEPAA